MSDIQCKKKERKINMTVSTEETGLEMRKGLKGPCHGSAVHFVTFYHLVAPCRYTT